MTSTWQRVRLGDLGRWGSGGTPSRGEPAYYGGGIPWLKISDLNDSLVTSSEETISELGLSNSSAKIVEEGTILIALYGSIGKLGIAGIPCTTNQAIAFCKPNDRVDRDFLFWKLHSLRDDLLRLGQGGAQSNISQQILKAYEVDIPSVEEQRRIVARIKTCMERIDEIGQLREQTFQEREHLIESMIEAELDGIDGDMVLLSSVCSITSALVDPREPHYQQLLHVGGANIESKTGQMGDLKTAVEEGLKSAKFTFDTSMVLYNKIRPYLMKVARPTFSGLCSADMYPLKPNEARLTRDYLFYLLMSRGFTEYAIGGSNRAGMPKVNREHLFAYEFALPPVSEQQRITERLDAALGAALGLKDELADAKTETSRLRSAVLRKAFAGEL